MLTREQLKDAATCIEQPCKKCVMGQDYGHQGECLEKVAKTALELMDEVDRLREIILARKSK